MVINFFSSEGAVQILRLSLSFEGLLHATDGRGVSLWLLIEKVEGLVWLLI